MIDGRLAQSLRGQIPAFHVVRLFALAAQRRAAGLPVYDLSLGQPSTPAPAPVRAAAHRALDAELLGYTSALGIDPLRAAIARHANDWYGTRVEADEVAITTGSSGAFLLAFLAAFDPGDAVALARPGYPAYRNMLTALGCRVVELPCGPKTGFQPTVEMLEALPEVPAGLVLASPANPTGSMVHPDELAAIVAWCDRRGVRLISDEIYHGISYGEAAVSARSLSDSPIVVNSFSKYFSMTGWRLGWLLVPDELRDAVERITGNFTLCPPALAQYAAVAAFEAGDELRGHVEHYRHNRALLLERLPEIGIRRFAPVDGAFYIYADVSQWTSDSLALAGRLLDETGVALASGVDFDPVDGGGFVRLSFAGDTAQIGQAVDVLGEWLDTQPSR